MKLLLTGARIIDPSQNMDARLDIILEEGKVAKTGTNLSKSTKSKDSEKITKIIDLQGMILVPGLIDMHVHLREPGFEYKETIATGAAAAVAGGFTSIVCMPNTDPVNDNRTTTEFIRRKAAEAALANVYPVGAISKDSAGSQLTEFWDLKEAGIVALSDDGKPVMNAALMRRAMEYAYSLQLPIISHCEDINLSANGVMNEGYYSTILGLNGIPGIAEEAMVARDILIAEFTKTAVHIAHVSTAGSVRLIHDAKARGLKVTAETAPHYFTLTDEALQCYDTNFKINPPLRSEKDVQAIKEGLADGTIDVIACDHAPHGRTDKEVEFEYAANGISGLETSLGLSLNLVSSKILTWPELIARMSLNPARILNLSKGTLEIGADADITVIDPLRQWTVDVQAFRSRGKNSPFHGLQMQGKAILTIVGGEIKYDDR
ncbi:MAG TPA: dihydroorotase [Smithella sp.]|nr:dihydroorotase [Smithella sp.]HNY51226.1 dihydroorotase [Smithella sp.]HOG91398.1 dihydroorotase [Smithella sp.]HOU52043.1 dihydroorotase [Smithella sp.]HQG66450.1 dihydroorotase [Smithella sp.]